MLARPAHRNVSDGHDRFQQQLGSDFSYVRSIVSRKREKGHFIHDT
jgi:hypothetical protein